MAVSASPPLGILRITQVARVTSLRSGQDNPPVACVVIPSNLQRGPPRA
ncbi:MAG: hypothetical protein ACO2PM_05245 [Pyrobaculum sp.]